MQRITEPELMDDPEQALAYAQADFSASHGRRVQIFCELFPEFNPSGSVLDLGCGSGDILLRFARRFPLAHFVGLDGSKPMLELARRAVDDEVGLAPRVRLIQGVIAEAMADGAALPEASWQLIMSHSLLHHLHRPQVLWRTIAAAARPGCAVFVADLRRPASVAEAASLVADGAANEPEILRRDFFNSLCAAFEPEEVREQLASAGLTQLSVRPQEPFHLTVHGWL